MLLGPNNAAPTRSGKAIRRKPSHSLRKQWGGAFSGCFKSHPSYSLGSKGLKIQHWLLSYLQVENVILRHQRIDHIAHE